MEDLGHVDVPSSHFVRVGKISLLIQDTMVGVVNDVDRCHERRSADHRIKKIYQHDCNMFFFSSIAA
jgi:hypothetical protein